MFGLANIKCASFHFLKALFIFRCEKILLQCLPNISQLSLFNQYLHFSGNKKCCSLKNKSWFSFFEPYLHFFVDYKNNQPSEFLNATVPANTNPLHQTSLWLAGELHVKLIHFI